MTIRSPGKEYPELAMNTTDLKEVLADGIAQPSPDAVETMRRTILLVEDNPINQKVACKVLEKHGYRVISAYNGREALEILENDVFDLILMDVQMPEMDGVETTRAIRQGAVSLCRPSVPIIALTAHSSMGDRERFFAAGVNDYVAKPFQVNELLAKVVRYCTLAPDRKADAAPQLPVISLTEVIGRFDGDRELIGELWETFKETAPGQVVNALHALGSGDLQTVAREAHSLKGAAANIGAVCFESAARDLHLAASGNHEERARRCGARLKDDLCRLLAEIDLHLASDSFKTGVK